MQVGILSKNFFGGELYLIQQLQHIHNLNVARQTLFMKFFFKFSLGELFVDQMLGLVGESMNPMTFGNMIHPSFSVAHSVLFIWIKTTYQKNCQDVRYCFLMWYSFFSWLLPLSSIPWKKRSVIFLNRFMRIENDLP